MSLLRQYIDLVEEKVSGTLIANTPVVPGRPLTDTQLAVMKMAIDGGKTYPPDIMAMYNKQTGQGGTQPFNPPAPPPVPTAPQAVAKPASETPPAQNVKTPGRKDPQIQALQQALVDAGFELPRYGVDGMMGPETQGAIKAAELALGRKPTGNILPQEIASISQVIQNNDLTKALSTIEAILAKYKIQVKEDIDIILENINMFTPAEQMQIWSILSEWDISGNAAYAQMQKDMDARAAQERVKSAYQGSQQAAQRYNQGVSASAAPKASMMQKIMQKLGPKLAGKLGTRAAAAGAASLVPGVGQAIGVGLAAWTAYDVAKELYDYFTKTDIKDLEDVDQEAVKQALPVIMKYNKDPKAMAALPDDLKTRVANAMKGLESLSAT